MQLAKALVRKQLSYKEPKLETTITEETDEQEYLNHTQNSLPQTELLTLITSIHPLMFGLMQRRPQPPRYKLKSTNKKKIFL